MSVAVILGTSIKKGDIVKIEWKPFTEIINIHKRLGYSTSHFISESDLDDHIAAIHSNTYFKVSEVRSGDLHRCCPQHRNTTYTPISAMPDEISIIDHLSDGDDLYVNENYIQKISVEHDVGETYFSDKFGISVLKIDGALFINGELVKKEDGDLINILESAISDLAIQKMFDGV